MILRDPALQLDPRVQRLWALEWGLAALVCAGIAVTLAVLFALAEEDLSAP